MANGIPPSVQGTAPKLQPAIRPDGSQPNYKNAPCGTNQITSPDNDGDEGQPYGR